MNDVPFTEEFKQGVMGMTRSEVTFGEHFPVYSPCLHSVPFTPFVSS